MSEIIYGRSPAEVNEDQVLQLMSAIETADKVFGKGKIPEISDEEIESILQGKMASAAIVERRIMRQLDEHTWKLILRNPGASWIDGARDRVLRAFH